jgi:hypothetical protein
MYEDSKYGFRQRKWFGLGAKWGGEATPYMYSSFATLTITEKGVKAGGFYMGTHDPGTITHVEKWYPSGPILIKKVGVFICSTLNNASGGLANFQFLTRGASASVIGTVQVSSCTESEGTIAASKTSLTVDQCKAGEYITIKSYEPTTKTNGTEVKATTTGRVAFFIDYVPRFDQSGRWDG